MSSRLRNNSEVLHVLKKAAPKFRKQLLKQADKELITTICECCLNVIKGHVRLTTGQKKKLAPHKKHIRQLADKKLSHTKRKRLIIQKGGFLGALLAPVLKTLGGLFLS